MLASAPKLDVFWSPSKPDNYIVFGSELILYEINKLNAKKADQILPQQIISDNTYGAHLSQNADTTFPKCMSWYPKKEKDYLVAVGQANGCVTLVSLDPKKNDDLINRVFSPKHARPCCCVGWSLDPSAPPMLAAGLDKFRTDSSLLIWDVTRIKPDTTSQRLADRSDLVDSDQYNKLGSPVREYGISEATYSLAWTSSNSIITGMHKYLRVVDLRDPGKFAKTTATKAVFGVCVDPQHEEKVASFVENQVSVWDLRWFDKALHTLPPQKSSIVKLGWCPRRLGLLACLSKDSSSVQVFDIQHTSSSHQEYELHFRERSVDTDNDQQICSFDWHPFNENRLLTVDHHGQVKDIKLFERIVIDVSPCGQDQEMCVSQVRHFGLTNVDNQEDISIIMRRRAIDMYGLQRDGQGKVSASLDPRQPEFVLWDWVDHMTHLIQTDSSFVNLVSSSTESTRFVGGSQITDNIRSTAIAREWQGVDTKNLNPIVHYHSPEREQYLKICRWPNKSTSVVTVMERLESEGHYEKATAIALFHASISDALMILNRGAEDAAAKNLSTGINLSIVAMALAGINTTNNALWLSKCKELHSKINNPYLRATFSFLTCGDNFKQILYESALSISDRVAFACIFLPDNQLREYLHNLQQDVIDHGDLSGVLVTGLNESGVDLLQQYIDNTGDIQTAALAMVHSFPSRMQGDERVTSWIKHYRNLLDNWKLWVLRAKFDVFHKEFVHKTDNSTISQVYLSCNFCNKSVIPLQMQQRRLYSTGGYGQNPNTVKVTICHECRKPLPRCALCLKNMGTASGILSTKLDHASGKSLSDGKSSAGSRKCADFSNWFTWCQSCRHGGHASHIEAWFKQHIECPVSGCTCKCSSLDNVPSLDPLHLCT